MAMDPSLKIQILLMIVILGVLVIGFMIIVQTIGAINHIYDRLEEIVSKETILRLERLSKEITLRENAKRAEDERKRRNDALLNVPIMRNPSEDEAARRKKK